MNSSKSSAASTKRNRRRKKKINTMKTLDSAPPPQDAVLGNDVDSAATDTTPSLKAEEGTLAWLVEAFSSLSVEQVRSAYREARGDAYTAADILQEASGNGGRGKLKRKKVVASTGLVSDVIGKGYGNGKSNGGGFGLERCGFVYDRGLGKENCRKEDSEEFLCSMLGDTCELDIGVIRDVLGHCGYDVEMALDMLLDMSATSKEQLKNSDCGKYKTNNFDYCQKTSGDCNVMNLKYKDLDHMFQPYDKDHQFVQSVAYCSREDTNLLCSSLGHPSDLSGASKQCLQQKVLESFFSISDISKREPNCMNWKKVIKKFEALGEGFEFGSVGTLESTQQALNDTGEDYHTLRSVAQQHWDSMKFYYQKAALAYSNGQRDHAACLSEKGKHFSRLAREEDEKASRNIFEAKNKHIQNVITIDLHGQHVKQAMMLLKIHVLILRYSPGGSFSFSSNSTPEGYYWVWHPWYGERKIEAISNQFLAERRDSVE